MKVLNIKKIIFFIVFLGIFLISFPVFAQECRTETDWPPSPMGTTLETQLVDGKCKYPSLTILVKYLYEWGLFIGGLAVFIALLIGGFLYLTSVGDPGKMREAKDRISSALIGLVILFSIYLILNTINPELTVLTPPTFEPPLIPPVSTEAFEKTEKSCDYTKLYKLPRYQGESKIAEASDGGTLTDLGDDFDPKSVRFLREIDPGTEKCADNTLRVKVTPPEGEPTWIPTTIYCEEREIPINGETIIKYYAEGGNCTMEMHEKADPPWWAFWEGTHCGDKKGNTNSSLHNLKLVYYSDIPIKCVMVTKTGL